MDKIGLLIDSTSHTCEELKNYEFIKSVYLKVAIGEKEYREHELSKSDMEKLISEGTKMLTSQPAPTDFLDAFEAFEKEGYTHVIVVVLSQHLSGTFQSAQIAKTMFESDLEVSVHSPEVASFGVANGLRLLAKDIESGLSFKEVMDRYYKIFQEPFVSFTLNNLKHLFRGGRLNRIQAFIGTVLRIKPIVQMIDGKLKMVQKERTNIACQDFFLDKITDYSNRYEEVHLDIIHLNMDKWAESLKEEVEKRFNNVILRITDYVSPVFYVHLGNKGFGIAMVGL